MIEKRRFHRVRYAARSVLTCNGVSHEGQLENLSLNGALIGFKGSILIRPGNAGALDIYVNGLTLPLRFEAEVVHSGFSMVGVKFRAMDPEVEVRLKELMGRLTPLPEKLEAEWAMSRGDE